MEYTLTDEKNRDKDGYCDEYIVKCKNRTELRHWMINHLDLSIEWTVGEWNPINKVSLF